MKAALVITAALGASLLAGCANREGVAPSQNSSLQTLSPSTTAESEGGYMQRSLDAWLKEKWTPMTAPEPVSTTAPEPTVPAPAPAASSSSAAAHETPSAPKPADNEPFTLQKYLDKWKAYNEKKAKMKEGKPQEPSHTEMMNDLPAVGSNVS